MSPTTTADDRPEARPRRAGLRLGLSAALILLLLASLVYLGARLVDSETGPVSWSKLGQVVTGGSQASELASEREAAMSQASKFTVRMNTYGPEDLDDKGAMPDYREQVEELASSKLRSQFLEEGVPLAEATVSQQGAGRAGEVYATGVAAIDDDTATVLVAGQVEFSFPKNPKKPEGERSVVDRQLFRYSVDLVKTGGEWLVDAWGPVAMPPGAGQMPDSLSGQGGTGSTGGAQ